MQAEETQVSFVDKITQAITGFFGSLGIRLIIIFVLGLLIAGIGADIIYPTLVENRANGLVQDLGEGAAKHLPSSPQILRTIQQHDLAWYYVTTPDGKVVPATKPYAPDLPKYDIAPRKITWRGMTYYEAVSKLNDTQILHVGMYDGQLILPNLSLGEKAMTLSMPFFYAFVLFALLFAVTLIALHMCVSQPLNKLARACYSLLLTRDAYSHVTGGGVNVPGAVSEVQSIGRGLKDIRRQYDEAIAAKAAKDDEIRRQRSDHQEEKAMLESQWQEQLSMTKHKLTELTTKEVEEEFINSLSREMDTLKSSKQIAQRILEKLNDKFPTSLIFGLFIRVQKGQQYTIDAILGFDDKSRQMIAKIDQMPILQEILQSGQYLNIGPQQLRDYGYQTLAQNNSVRNILYLPLKAQNRDLGAMAFFFVQEGQTVQERLRVLRNTADLASRTLYQTTIYEEETEAARTDPLTGLRNKKYFYEIMPQIFEKASLKPADNPISVIMIDGDHFKSVNDTYGHQVGDKMLKELATIIRQCTRAQETLQMTNAPGDYVIRFGGEEFVVVMEKADAGRAMPVAERIRQAVEAKTDWPGGITRWTVSLGVATYPTDGKAADELMEKADVALYYVKEELGRNKVCHTQQVPRTFKAKKTAAAIAGELGVFDAAGLLQSIATSQKTGVLTVQSGDGRQLWMLFEAGRPIQARMGKIQGSQAITEFLVTYEEGSFNFQELVQSASSAKLPKLEDTYNVTRSLERCLMDGALAQDNYNLARTVISSANIYIRPKPQDEFVAKWNALGQLDEPPSQDEFAAMSEIIKRSNGKATLEKTFQEMQPMPTHLMWRAASLLVQHGLVDTKDA
jgi:diguanylate cyclase (GGDEF)-like protein